VKNVWEKEAGNKRKRGKGAKIAAVEEVNPLKQRLKQMSCITWI